MNATEVLVLLWFCVAVGVGCVFSLIAGTREDDDWEQLIKQPPRFTSSNDQIDVRRKPPFDWEVEAS